MSCAPRQDGGGMPQHCFTGTPLCAGLKPSELIGLSAGNCRWQKSLCGPFAGKHLHSCRTSPWPFATSSCPFDRCTRDLSTAFSYSACVCVCFWCGVGRATYIPRHDFLLANRRFAASDGAALHGKLDGTLAVADVARALSWGLAALDLCSVTDRHLLHWFLWLRRARIVDSAGPTTILNSSSPPPVIACNLVILFGVPSFSSLAVSDRSNCIWRQHTVK